MDINEVRRSTMELLGTSEEADVAYIDEDLVSEYEAEADDAEQAGEHEALSPPDDAPVVDPEYHVYYGNHLVHGSGGRLYFSNASANRPNDPCGRLHRWYVQLTVGSRINPFRNCGSFWGYQIIVL
jgi:hypothetical protein